ncbi:MAG: aspartate aminotransferase family protein, partial [Candidatus Sericytochromatia bacterium]|nr:aspartate aminotransferase family protein [Candidatus Sericytochromatia bacterium]
MEDQELKEKRKKYLSHSVFHYYSEPLHLVKAKDTRVWDSQGKEYIDCICGIVSISIGHNHPKIKEALKAKFDNDDIQHGPTIYLTEPVVRLAENLVEKAPGLDRAFISNSGSEANEYAVMAARNVTGNETMIALRHGYHGGTNMTLGLCGHSSWKFKSQPFASIVHAVQPDCYRCPFGKKKETCSVECAKDVENVILTATNGKIAGVIVEPILGVGGFIDPPPAYHKEVHRICKKYGGMYISDEVQTGIGRTGDSFFAIYDSGVTPDMITMAKSLGNGAPVGAVVMTEECSVALKGKVHFNTFGGDPFQALQAAMTVEIIEEEKLMENAKAMGQILKDGLKALMEKYTLIGDVRGRGLLLGFELVKDRETKEYATAEVNQMMEETRKRGLLIGKGGLGGNVVRITPSYTINKDDCEKILSILDKSLDAIVNK